MVDSNNVKSKNISTFIIYNLLALAFIQILIFIGYQKANQGFFLGPGGENLKY